MSTLPYVDPEIGTVQVKTVLFPKMPNVQTTKLDVLMAEVNALQVELDKRKSYLEGLYETPCGLTCSGCGAELDTEADFAGHFYVKRNDLINHLLNLGHCPNVD